jgi:hypothetical protein
MKKIWRGFKRFWHDQITTPNGDVDGSRVGLLIILVAACFFIYFAYNAYVVKSQTFDPSGFGDGLVKVGAALLAAAAGVKVKSGTESPYNPQVAAANFPDDPGAQMAAMESAAANGAQQTVNAMGELAQTEISQADGFIASLKSVWQSVKNFFK